MKLSVLILLLVGLCSCSTRSAWLKFARSYETTHSGPPPRYFWRGAGLANGQIVLDGIHSGDAESRAKVRALIGSSVVFVGEGTRGLRRDLWSDLVTSDGTEIMVDIVPFQDVHPGPCGEWGVEVKGKLESVDFEKRMIRIEAKPENWKDTWQL
jgi:hypothetical protein